MKVTIEQLRKALRQDFHSLYVKEYSTNWEVERFVRDIELGVMSFENTLKLINGVKVKNVGINIDNYADMDD